MSEEQKKQTESMREYLKIKKISEEDKSDEMIEEVYEEIIGNNTRNNGTSGKVIEERWLYK